MWVRGLKHEGEVLIGGVVGVAPYVGAWIETWMVSHGSNKLFGSHPMWVRGLKQLIRCWGDIQQWSHPMWVRGLKL